MVQKLETLIESASQTAGPYVHIGLMPTYAGNAGYYDEEIGTTPFLDESKAKGEIVEIVGSVFDGTGDARCVDRELAMRCWGRVSGR
jgi:protocatechuate 3,4-dioxygenase alpha subunit